MVLWMMTMMRLKLHLGRGRQHSRNCLSSAPLIPSLEWSSSAFVKVPLTVPASFIASTAHAQIQTAALTRFGRKACGGMLWMRTARSSRLLLHSSSQSCPGYAFAHPKRPSPAKPSSPHMNQIVVQWCSFWTSSSGMS